MKTGDLVQISTDIQDKLCGSLGILVEEINEIDMGTIQDEITISPEDSMRPYQFDEKYFNVYVEGRCYLYGNYELLLISSSGN